MVYELRLLWRPPQMTAIPSTDQLNISVIESQQNDQMQIHCFFSLRASFGGLTINDFQHDHNCLSVFPNSIIRIALHSREPILAIRNAMLNDFKLLTVRFPLICKKLTFDHELILFVSENNVLVFNICVLVGETILIIES